MIYNINHTQYVMLQIYEYYEINAIWIINCIIYIEIINIINYCNYINLDYARLELIRDENLGLCLIDVNNSPGGGPLTNLISNRLSEILMNII